MTISDNVFFFLYEANEILFYLGEHDDFLAFWVRILIYHHYGYFFDQVHSSMISKLIHQNKKQNGE